MTTEPTLQNALDQLMHAAAEAPDTRWTARVLASAVVDLERAAGAGLGAADQDPLVVLHRRLGRAHRLLAVARSNVDLDAVRAHLQALHQPAGTARAEPADDAAPALAHAC